MFCGVTGDYNPYHQNAAFASESWYGRLTVANLLTGSMLTHIGGPLGFLATEMSFEYLAPAFSVTRYSAPCRSLERKKRSAGLRLTLGSSTRTASRCYGRSSLVSPVTSAWRVNRNWPPRSES